jgi:hypothetical protein
MINVQVEKGANDNNIGLLRKFTKRVQGSGVLNRIRSIRYAERSPSRYTKKKFALKALRYRENNELLLKQGKIKPVERGVRR